MKVNRDASYTMFMNAVDALEWLGVRLKNIRDAKLTPGGRAHLQLFEAASKSGRAHPRLRVEVASVEDPHPVPTYFTQDDKLENPADFRALLETALRKHSDYLSAQDVDNTDVVGESSCYHRNSIRCQRTAQLFADARALLAQQSWSEPDQLAGSFALHVLEDESYAGDIRYDDSDTGTYHSYGKDEPFVHYLEKSLASLPTPNSKAFAVLSAGQRKAIRNQKQQIQNHLDYLMRNKYAYGGICETDIERSLGGFLIDRQTRQIVSEDPSSAESVVPQYELLRIRRSADHPHAGAWIYRSGESFKLADHTTVEVDQKQVKRSAVDAERLTFRRAPKHPSLRPGIRLDWDRNGYVQPGKIEWVSWAGHCDIKAIMESLGLTLRDKPSLYEYRSDMAEAGIRGIVIGAFEKSGKITEFGTKNRTLAGSDLGWCAGWILNDFLEIWVAGVERSTGHKHVPWGILNYLPSPAGRQPSHGYCPGDST